MNFSKLKDILCCKILEEQSKQSESIKIAKTFEIQDKEGNATLGNNSTFERENEESKMSPVEKLKAGYQSTDDSAELDRESPSKDNIVNAVPVNSPEVQEFSTNAPEESEAVPEGIHIEE